MDFFLHLLIFAIVLVVIGTMLFRHWINDHLPVLHMAISIVGGIASLFIAFFAANIDERVAENAIKQAQTNRSVSLGESILRDQAVVGLIQTAVRVERAYDRAVSNDASREDFARAKIDALVTQMHDETKDYYPGMALLLQHVERAVRCIGPDPAQERSAFPPTCDRTTFMALSGSALADLYFVLRPIYYCDPFFKNDEDVEKYADFVFDYSIGEKRHNGHPIEVFRTPEEAEAAVADGGENTEMMVIGLSDRQICEYYSNAVSRRSAEAI